MTGDIVPIARFALASVFVLAGVAKLSDHAGVRQMVVEFGSPSWLATPLAWLLVGAELSTAAALMFGPSAHAGAVAALVLLLVFGAAVAITVSRGQSPECHCFGRLRPSEVGWSTVARNALLAIVAGFVATAGRFPLAFAALAALALAVWLVLAAQRPSLLRLGAPAPPFSLPDHTGGDWTLESLLGSGRPLLLVFSDPDCGACQELLPEVARWQQRLDSEVTVAVLSGGSIPDSVRVANEFGLGTALLDQSRNAAAAYGITATPSAVLVDRAGRIAARPAVGAEEIARLIAHTGAPGDGPALARRAVLVRAARGAAAVSVVPFVSSAAALAQSVRRAVRPKRLKIDGAWLCDQRYALCTFAACEPSKTDKNVSVCRCKVKTGYSVGFKSCQKRAPRGRQLHSNFSLQDVSNRTRVLKCSERGLWVQCLDVVCEVDRDDTRHASCQCVNERTRNFYTFGGNCDTRTCKTVIWSATTAPFPGGAQYEKGLKRLGIRFKSPKSCPRPKSAQP
jgi:peroxiredoxin